MIQQPIKLVAIDLDGTLLTDEKRISTNDIATLYDLGRKGILRVAATGRSMHKVHEVLRQDAPFDFIVFSSGSGIFDWKKHEIITSEEFRAETISSLFESILKHQINFFTFQPIPANNYFWYHIGAGKCNEFEYYIERHHRDCKQLDTRRLPERAGQFMCILPNDEMLFDSLRSKLVETCAGIKIIRTTSPVNGKFIWMEIFPDTVSKGHGLERLCKQSKIAASETLVLGNDFNDLDMLEFSGHPWVVNNASEALKARYATIDATNNQNSLSSLSLKYGLIS
jgi:Cof subfamily protein (haloacid dehalogenase superfamily)